MPPVPLLTPSEVVKIFKMFEWSVARQRGSYIILTTVGHIATLSVPNHDQVARGTLRSLISKAGLTVVEFVDALNQ